MPAYFSMTLLFKQERIKPKFVKELYSQIIANGFSFKSGYWFHKKAKLDDIIEWNQSLLEKGFRLGPKQHVKHDYMQILFESDYYSELRGFWIYSEKQVVFHLIIPECDVLNYEGEFFIESKITPIKDLAKNIWESNMVDAIQTSVEIDEGFFDLSAIQSGSNISVNPFAILSESLFSCFSSSYFCDKTSYTIRNAGVVIKVDGKVR